MIFFFDGLGNSIKSIPESINQSSNNASRIWFVMPTAPTNVVTVAFTLPNGQYSKPRIMTNATDGLGLVNNGVEITDNDDQICNAWFYDVPKNLTTFAGKLKLQFTVTTAQGVEITTDSPEITIIKGAPSYTLPAPENEYQAIINAISAINLTLENLVEDTSSEIEEFKSQITQQQQNFETQITEQQNNFETAQTERQTQFEDYLNAQWTEKSNALTEQFNDLEQSVTEQVTKNTNEIKALFGLNVTKGVLAYDNATSTAEVQQTGGADLAGLNILDGSYATVNKIQGKTVKSANLFDISKVTGLATYNTTPPGLDASQYLAKNSDGSITVKVGGYSQRVYFTGTKMFLPVGDYTISATITNNESFADNSVFGFIDINGNKSDGYTEKISANTTKRISYTYSITTAGEYYLILSPTGGPSNSNNLNITYSDIQVEYGNTATAYTPYFDGLKNAQISGIKSVSNLLKWKGRTRASSTANAASTQRVLSESEYWDNLSGGGIWVLDNLDYSHSVLNDNSISLEVKTGYYGVGFPVKCKPNTTYTKSAVVSNLIPEGTGYHIYALFYDSNGSYLSNTLKATFTTPENAEWLVINIVLAANNSTAEIRDIMLNYGSTALPYREYEESIMQLPETVELGEWDNITGKTLTKNTSEILTLTGNEGFRTSTNLMGWSYAELGYYTYTDTETQQEITAQTGYVKIDYLPPETIALKSVQTPITANPYKGLDGYYWGNGAGESGNHEGVYANNFAFGDGFRAQVGVQLLKTTIGFDANNIPEYENLPDNVTRETKYLTDLMLDYIKANPLTLVSKLLEPTVTELDFNNEYLVWDKGQETVLTPTDESGNTCFDYGANTTTETDYWVIVGGNE